MLPDHMWEKKESEPDKEDGCKCDEDCFTNSWHHTTACAHSCEVSKQNENHNLNLNHAQNYKEDMIL